MLTFAKQLTMLPTSSVYEGDVLREQLDYLIEHTVHSVECGCSVCVRYSRARDILLEIFGEPAVAAIRERRNSLATAA